MQKVTKQELNAVLELLKQHVKVVSKEQYIKDIGAMQSKLDSKAETEKTASATPEQ